MPISCGETVTGELTPDVCNLGDGTEIDFWVFPFEESEVGRLSVHEEVRMRNALAP